MKRIGVALAAIVLGLAMASTAQASVTTTGSCTDQCAVTESSGITVDQPVSDPDVLTDGGADVLSGGAKAYCNSAVYYRYIYNAAHITMAKIWNHSRWCYYYGGKVYFRTGYTDTYTAPAWDVSNVSWSKGWWTPYTQWFSQAQGKFFLDIAGHHVQTWNANVCIKLGNHGGVAWC